MTASRDHHAPSTPAARARPPAIVRVPVSGSLVLELHQAEDLARALHDGLTASTALDTAPDDILTVLRDGPLSFGDIRSRVSRSTNIVRATLQSLAAAELVERASPPPGASKRPTYWQLVPHRD